jgi:regulator of RNase E activity RraA
MRLRNRSEGSVVEYQELYKYGVPVEKLIQRYSRLYTADAYDAMDRMGLPNQALARDIKCLAGDAVLAGPAFTVKGIPDPRDDKGSRTRRVQMFADMRSLDCPVLDVRDCSFDTQVAHYGEMNAMVGKACGAIGAVVDGGCRDSGLLLEQRFPVFCRYRLPVEAHKHWSYQDWQVPVGLRGALSRVVTVRPGDFLFGDPDGVLVIPRELVVEVLRKTEELVEGEDKVRAEIAAGGDPVTVYRKYGKL